VPLIYSASSFCMLESSELDTMVAMF